MRILVHDYAGHPFQAQLSRELARRGHAVLHAHCASYASGKGDLERRIDDPGNLQFGALDLGSPFARHAFGRRLRQEMQYGRLLVRCAQAFQPDVVISANTPLFSQWQLQRWAKRNRTGFVFWLQDLISMAMAKQLRRRVPVLGVIGSMALVRLEQHLLKGSEVIVAITPDFEGVLQELGVDGSRVKVIQNWAPLDELPPMPRSNEWSKEHQLDDKFVFLYAGTLGLKHDPELLIDLAVAVANLGAIVVVVSEGNIADSIQVEGRRLGLDNLRVIPFQPYNRLPEVLATGDVLLAILEHDAAIYSVPSKVLTYLCAGRPIVASIPHLNLAASTISASGAGTTVDPADRAAFVNAAITMFKDLSLRVGNGQSARHYAEQTFDIRRIGSKFEEVAIQALAHTEGRTPKTCP